MGGAEEGNTSGLQMGLLAGDNLWGSMRQRSLSLPRCGSSDSVQQSVHSG